jgi:hypothetical protein
VPASATVWVGTPRASNCAYAPSNCPVLKYTAGSTGAAELSEEDAAPPAFLPCLPRLPPPPEAGGVRRPFTNWSKRARPWSNAICSWYCLGREQRNWGRVKR